MNIKGLIFDLDGVLVDTVPMHFAAWKRMFEEYGYSFGKREYRNLVDGRPRLDGARAVMINHSEQDIKEAADKKNDYYVEMIDRGEFQVFEAARNLVRNSQAKGYRLAAASSSVNVRAVLEKAGIRDAFSVIIGGDEVVNGKPDPEIFLNAAEGLGFTVEECIVFEDSSSGVRAAKTAGFYCVGLQNEDNADDLIGADEVLFSLSDLDIKKIESSMAVANPV